jgi:UDPglucose 6-dehydrogenase/GDP-mannose 6-dehydrogenase
MKISIFGTGYVGLVTGVCFAEKGYPVVCVDIDPDKINTLNAGIPPMEEKDLQELLQKNLHKRLRATLDSRQAVLETDVSLIAVGTPSHEKGIDLSYINEISREIGAALKEKSAYHVVAVKSTVIPGTTDEVVLPALEKASGKKAGADFGVGMNPEFLTEGQAVQDFMAPDRIVIGGIDKKTTDVLERLYECFPSVPRIKTNNKTAEMIKYTSNALLATMISFSNEIGNLCAALGDVDVVDVMRGVHLSQYFSSRSPTGERLMPAIVSFLAAGCGFGGSCLPKDLKALRAHGEKVGVPMRMLDAVLHVNEQQPQKVAFLLKKHFPSLRGVRIAILGLAFRPDTSDMRESPAIPIINQLLAEGAILKAYDPVANSEARKLFENSKVRLCSGLEEVIQESQAIVLVTRWDEFRQIPRLLAPMNPQPVFIDGRRMLDKNSINKYEGIGL